MMQIETLYKFFNKSTGISTDSRNIKPGNMFFALKGESFNGNLYAQQAIDKGAICAVIDEPGEHAKHDGFIVVKNVLQTLQELAHFHRNKLKCIIIGITGTNGKTTTKELIYQVLKQKFDTQATVGNLNNHIGVPLTLLSLHEETEFAIVEMGANHNGEIKELCTIAKPDYGIITNIGKAHLEGFGSFEAVIKTKSELYDEIKQSGKLVFVNGENDLLMSLSENQERFCFGSSENFNIQGENDPTEFMLTLQVVENQTRHIINTKLFGGYNFENAMYAMAVGKYFGVSFKDIKEALENYEPNLIRSQYKKTANNELILDCYNANPTSMEKALLNFRSLKKINKIAILGDMLELGDYSDKEHKNIVDFVEKENIKAFFIGTQFMKHQNTGHGTFFETTEKCDVYLKNNPLKDNLILLKGSRGMKLEGLAEFL